MTSSLLNYLLKTDRGDHNSSPWAMLRLSLMLEQGSYIQNRQQNRILWQFHYIKSNSLTISELETEFSKTNISGPSILASSGFNVKIPGHLCKISCFPDASQNSLTLKIIKLNSLLCPYYVWTLLKALRNYDLNKGTIQRFKSFLLSSACFKEQTKTEVCT